MSPPRLRSAGAGTRSGTAAVALAALVLCAPWLFAFEARVTDLSALRVAHGDVPYRDFWTMYAPGSFLVMALVFRALGEQLFWSNLLGVLTTAACAAALHRLVAPIVPRGPALLLALVFALAFVQSGYHDGFTSFPPALLCVLIATGRVTAFARDGRRRDLVLAGLALGVGACSKHDVAAYAAMASMLVLLRRGAGSPGQRLGLLLGTAAIPVAALLCALLLAGAGPDLWQDLVVFPTTHFRHVRPELFPLWPPLPKHWPADGAGAYRLARDVCGWAILHLPTLALLIGLFGAWRHRARLDDGARALVAIATLSFPLFWLAAHVQINTHKVTLAALGCVVLGVGLAASPRVLASLCTVWSLVLLAEPFETLRVRLRDGTEPIDLPRLAAIRVTPREATWMRGLARAMANAARHDAPLLLAGRRNDVLIYANSTPFWLSDRRPATRHHELHPGITDTESVQRRMIADLGKGTAPVVVREHRFDDRAHDHWRDDFQSHGVPVGSRLLDEWIAARYRPGARFGMYEVMEPKR